jgi:Protein of unknown function (DUF669)
MPTNPNEVTEEAYNQAVFEDGGNLVVDLGGINEAKFEAVPKGLYEGEIDSAEYGLSQNSGNPMITLQVAITEGQYSGRKHYTFWSFSQKALPFTKAAINRIAPDLIAAGKFSPQRVCDEGMLLGRKCRIRITHEEYNGEMRSRIGQLLPPLGNGAAGGPAGTPGKTNFF